MKKPGRANETDITLAVWVSENSAATDSPLPTNLVQCAGLLRVALTPFHEVDSAHYTVSANSHRVPILKYVQLTLWSIKKYKEKLSKHLQQYHEISGNCFVL